MGLTERSLVAFGGRRRRPFGNRPSRRRVLRRLGHLPDCARRGRSAQSRRGHRELEGGRIGDIELILANTPEYFVIRQSRICWPRSTCSRSKQPASLSPLRCSSASSKSRRARTATRCRNPSRSRGGDRWRCGQPEAGLGRSRRAEATAHRQGYVVPISRSRYRSRRRNLYKVATNVLRRFRRNGRIFVRPFGIIPSRRSCWWSIQVAKSSARRSATMSICAISKAAQPCCSAGPRITTPRPQSGRSCVSSMGHFRLTMCARPR